MTYPTIVNVPPHLLPQAGVAVLREQMDSVCQRLERATEAPSDCAVTLFIHDEFPAPVLDWTPIVTNCELKGVKWQK